MKLSKRLGEVSGGYDYTDLPPGYYIVQITSAKEYPEKEYLKLEMKVLRTPSGKEVYVDELVSDIISLKEKALWRLKAFLVAIYGKEKTEQMDAFDENDLIGKSVVIEVVKDGSGYRNTRVSIYKSVDKWAKLMNMDISHRVLGSKVATSAKKMAEPEAPEETEAIDSVSSDDEDIPF
jgi:hypothetical protein